LDKFIISSGRGEPWRNLAMEYVTDYFWVVICKNHRFHRKGNTSHEHHIPLSETDAFSSLPMLTEQIRVRCDGCGEEHSYKPKEVMRAEIEVPEHFDVHPLFR
jgi:hypothetical protein